jgi:CubicO group peptidase (beta-lactamase class C family)
MRFTFFPARKWFWVSHALAIVVLLALPAYGETHEIEEKLRALRALEEAVGPGDPGAAALVAQDGKILFEEGRGMADLEHDVPVTPETKFRIGSITKQFTAAAILKLQEEGKLNVNDKLAKFIPDFPRGDEVTLRHLLTHTSGIHSYTSKPDFMSGVTNPVTITDLINSFKGDPFDFDPGTKWAYDNSGYLLLGYIVEKVSGESYGDFLRENFFEPLGMTNTGVYRSGAPISHEALGYAFKDGKFGRAINWDMSWAGGAGALYSTVEDLYRWNEGIFDGKVLSEASLAAAFTPVRVSENEEKSDSGYGFGWAIVETRGLREISHSGGLDGFSSFLMRIPSAHFTVAVLANSSSAPKILPADLARKIMEIYLADKLAPLPVADTNVSANAFDAYVGRYDYGGPIMTISRQGNHLYAQLAGQPKFEIYPASDSKFFWKVTEAEVTFVKDKDGKVIKALHQQNGSVIDAPRLPDEKEAKVDPKVYDSVVGKYDYGGGKVILTVTREGNEVFGQLTGQPKYEIFPKSDTEFFWKVVDAQVTFVKDDHGKVYKVIHHQSGRSFEAPKIDDTP